MKKPLCSIQRPLGLGVRSAPAENHCQRLGQASVGNLKSSLFSLTTSLLVFKVLLKFQWKGFIPLMFT